jgi:hypothetical protein
VTFTITVTNIGNTTSTATTVDWYTTDPDGVETEPYPTGTAISALTAGASYSFQVQMSATSCPLHPAPTYIESFRIIPITGEPLPNNRQDVAVTWLGAAG